MTTAVTAHRTRLRARGLKRLELHVPDQDAALLRAVASALTDPTRAPAARRALRAQFDLATPDLKALLAAAPLDGIDLTRSRDPARDVDL